MTREIKTAILVIASIALFIWGYSFLKGSNILNDHKRLYVEYENVEGLTTGAPVTVSGKIIGKVNAIKLTNLGTLLLELQINEEDFPISKTSVAQIYEPGFIGGKQIAIIPNYKDQNMAVNGDKLMPNVKIGLISAFGDKLEPLQERLEKLLANADVMITNINSVLDAQTQANLKSAIKEMNNTMSNFSKASSNIDGMLTENKAKIGNTISNFDKTSQNFANISSDLEKAKLDQTVAKLQSTLDNVNKIIANIDSGNGTIGKLMKDEKLYNNFAKTSKELELLLQDVRLNPTRYVNVSVFGKKNKPYIAPANDSISSKNK